MLLRKFWLIGMVCGLFIQSVKTVGAVEPFETSMETVYTLDLVGNAKVRHTVILTNTTSDQYAKQFTFGLGSRRTEDLKAYGPSIPEIPILLSLENGTQVITLNFPDSVVGRGKKRTFTLEYVDLDGSQQIGSILEIGIPQADPALHVDKHELTVIVPKELGELSVVHPSKEAAISQDAAFTKVEFGPKVLQQQSVTLLFGTEQHFAFSLKYNLANDTITPIVTQVALPPDTRYQRVWFEVMEPRPSEIHIDEDGNWIATYALEPKQHITAVVKGGVATNLGENESVNSPTANLNNYLQVQPYWESNDSTVVGIAKELQTPEAIYDYLVKNFKYNYDRIDTLSTSRMGGKLALESPQNVLCMEFADAFVTLSRAAGIPARLITGHAITENNRLRPLSYVQDILHAWPEYFDMETKQWVMIDPTWASTTGGVDYFHNFDFNHITFAIQGLDSQKPYPAGLYKLPNQVTKDVEIEVVPIDEEPKSQLKSQLSLPWLTKLGWQSKAILKVENLVGKAEYDQPILITNANNDVPLANSELQMLLPFQTIEVPLQFDELPKKGENIYIIIGDHKVEQTIIYSEWLARISRVAFALIVAGGIGVIVYKTWRILVSE